MDNHDLQYIFDNIPYKNPNIYPKIKVSTQNLHIDYLENSNLKYDVSNTKIRKIKNINIYRLDGSLINTVTNPNYPTNSKLGIRLAGNKLKTEALLKLYRLNTTNSKLYSIHDKEKAYEEAYKDNNYPVVIKPLNGTMGNGVFVNVKKDRFKNCWDLTSEIPNSKSGILVQDFMQGFEVRVTIMEGNIVSLLLRVPPYVIGDGENDVNNLIKIKNVERSKCGYLKNLPITIDDKIIEYLKSNHTSLLDVPKKGEYFLLSSVSNISNGGELIDITDIVGDEIKEFALNILAAMPGLYTGGLDIMIKSFNDISPSLIEVNTFPVIALPTYPTYGESRNPSKYYYESLVALDQMSNDVSYKYNIANEEEYLRKYLNFTYRKNKLINENYNSLKEIYL